MSMQLLTTNNVKVYNVTSGKSLPDWKTPSRKIKSDIDFRNRIELIQDFQFPVAARRLKFTPDGSHAIATGVYKPMVRVFDLSELSLKFERHLDCETVQFQILSDDWTKLVFLQADRCIDFHTQFGFHHRTRIPRFGRDMAYDRRTCDLVLVGDSHEAWRINMELGRNMSSFATSRRALNIVKINPQHGLFAFGGEEGIVEFWDPRVKNLVAELNVGSSLVKAYSNEAESPEISAMRFHSDGLLTAIGTSSGHVVLYDLRHSKPLLTKDHQYGCPIIDIKIHGPSGKIISSDSKVVRIWEKFDGKPYTSIESESPINDASYYPDSGLFLMACETSKMSAFYVPSLGIAPKWCSFLDNMTEELEEKKNTVVYDDYKFVTPRELADLGLDHLKGTNLLRAYMHGFFIDIRLYEKAKSIVNPFAYDEFLKKKIEEKLAKERESRIVLPKKLPKVNRRLVEKLSEEPSIPSKRNEISHIQHVLSDDRFSAMFANPDFEINEDSEEYRRLHPNLKKADSTPALVQQLFEEEDEETQQKEKPSSGFDLRDLEETPYTKRNSDLDSESESEEEMHSIKKKTRKESKMKLYSLKAGVSRDSVLHPQIAAMENAQRSMSLGHRLEAMSSSMMEGPAPVGAMTMTFANDKPSKMNPRSKENAVKRASSEPDHRQRRGVRSLPSKKSSSRGGPKRYRR